MLSLQKNYGAQSFLNIIIIYRDVNSGKMPTIPSTRKQRYSQYRMPHMTVIIEKEEGQIKTSIPNLGQIAQALKTNVQYILEWFAIDRSTNVALKEDKEAKKISYLINGQFTEDYLREVLDSFILKYICCRKCGIPGIYLSVTADKVYGECGKCFFTCKLDFQHKLTLFIVKNPPIYKKQAKEMAKDIAKKVQSEQVLINPACKVKKQVKQGIDRSFNADKMKLGSYQISRFICYLRSQMQEEVSLQKAKSQEIYGKSIKIAHFIDILGLKISLAAHIAFKLIFSRKNLSRIHPNQSKLYLNLMNRFINGNSQAETLLNLQYLFLEDQREQYPQKFLSNFLHNFVKEGLFSEQFLLQWNNGKIRDIKWHFLYDENRDKLFKSYVQPYLDSIGQYDYSDQEAAS